MSDITKISLKGTVLDIKDENAYHTGDLATVATSGSYDDLLNKPNIPTAQVQTDWNATSGLGVVLNKPTIPSDLGDLTNNAGYLTSEDIAGKADSADLATVATTGSYNDLLNKPTIPAAQVQSDWNATSGMGVILNKPTIPTIDTTLSSSSQANAVQGGAIVEALAGKEDTLTWDSAPTSSSTNPVTSGGVYTALQGKQDTISNLATITANAGKGVADVTASTGAVTITLANEDTYIIDLNHNHPAYLEIADIGDYVTAGSNVSIAKDSTTGVLTISATGGGSAGVSDVTYNNSSFVSSGVASLDSVIPDVSNCVQSTSVTNIVVCADETTYNNISSKDNNTLYLIKESNA